MGPKQHYAICSYINNLKEFFKADFIDYVINELPYGVIKTIDITIKRNDIDIKVLPFTQMEMISNLLPDFSTSIFISFYTETMEELNEFIARFNLPDNNGITLESLTKSFLIEFENKQLGKNKMKKETAMDQMVYKLKKMFDEPEYIFLTKYPNYFEVQIANSTKAFDALHCKLSKQVGSDLYYHKFFIRFGADSNKEILSWEKKFNKNLTLDKDSLNILVNGFLALFEPEENYLNKLPHPTHEELEDLAKNFKAQREESINELKQEFKKNDKDKFLYNLLPSKELEQVVEVLTQGAKKYGIDNWKKCNDKTRYINALYRHLEAYRQGEMLDKEDNLHHLAHLACNALFLLYFENNKI